MPAGGVGGRVDARFHLGRYGVAAKSPQGYEYRYNCGGLYAQVGVGGVGVDEHGEAAFVELLEQAEHRGRHGERACGVVGRLLAEASGQGFGVGGGEGELSPQAHEQVGAQALGAGAVGLVGYLAEHGGYRGAGAHGQGAACAAIGRVLVGGAFGHDQVLCHGEYAGEYRAVDVFAAGVGHSRCQEVEQVGVVGVEGVEAREHRGVCGLVAARGHGLGYFAAQGVDGLGGAVLLHQGLYGVLESIELL